MPRNPTGSRVRFGRREVSVMVNRQRYYRRFPLTTTPAEIEAWRKQMRDEHDETPVEQGSLEDCIVNRYLPTVTGKATYKQMVAHLDIWMDALGRDRTPTSVKSFEIDVIMQGWLTTPSVFGPGEKGRPSGPDGLDPQTIRKRRTNLRSFYVKLDKLNGGNGKTGYNPVTGTWCPKPPKPGVRGTDYATIDKILAAMPEWVDTRKARGNRPAAPRVRALGRLRCAVIAYTGLPPGILATIKPADIRWQRREVYIEAGRDKGDGVPACTLELLDDGFDAFKALAEAGGLGPFAAGPLNVGFQRAAKRVGEGHLGLTVYDLRHSFGALVYEETGDRATVGRFLLHAENSTATARYANAANKKVDRAAAGAISAALAQMRKDARPARRRRRPRTAAA